MVTLHEVFECLYLPQGRRSVAKHGRSVHLEGQRWMVRVALWTARVSYMGIEDISCRALIDWVALNIYQLKKYFADLMSSKSRSPRGGSGGNTISGCSLSNSSSNVSKSGLECKSTKFERSISFIWSTLPA